MFDELTQLKYLKEIIALKSLLVKAKTYLEANRASMMKLFCENS